MKKLIFVFCLLALASVAFSQDFTVLSGTDLSRVTSVSPGGYVVMNPNTLNTTGVQAPFVFSKGGDRVNTAEFQVTFGGVVAEAFAVSDNNLGVIVPNIPEGQNEVSVTSRNMSGKVRINIIGRHPTAVHTPDSTGGLRLYIEDSGNDPSNRYFNLYGSGGRGKDLAPGVVPVENIPILNDAKFLIWIDGILIPDAFVGAWAVKGYAALDAYVFKIPLEMQKELHLSDVLDPTLFEIYASVDGQYYKLNLGKILVSQ